MNYEQFFADRISDLRVEGRYRVFADLERQVGVSQSDELHRQRQGRRRSAFQRLSQRSQNERSLPAWQP